MKKSVLLLISIALSMTGCAEIMKSMEIKRGVDNNVFHSSRIPVTVQVEERLNYKGNDEHHVTSESTMGTSSTPVEYNRYSFKDHSDNSQLRITVERLRPGNNRWYLEPMDCSKMGKTMYSQGHVTLGGKDFKTCLITAENSKKTLKLAKRYEYLNQSDLTRLGVVYFENLSYTMKKAGKFGASLSPEQQEELTKFEERANNSFKIGSRKEWEAKNSTTQSNHAPQPLTPQSTATIEERLKKLDELFHDKRIISKQEYDKKREEILKDF